MKNKNIPINKGNYSMESPEREALFEKYRGENWEKDYKGYREKWVSHAKEQYVDEFPQLVDIELSSVCNLNCPMCYTITEAFKQKVNAKLMDFVLFKKIIDEIAGKVPAIRLSLRGEPTLHPQFIECIKYAKEKGIGEVSTLTNSSKLTPEYFKEMMLAGIDWITISVDGLYGTYDSIRKPLKFEETLQKIKNMKSLKEEYKRNKPVIKIQSIWPAIKENPEEFYNTFAPYVNLVAFNPLIDYLGKDEEIIYEEDFSCPQLYQRLVIGADGLVMMCSNDENGTLIVGDTNIESVYDIWHGEKLNSIRNIHKQEKGFFEISICKHCYLPRMTEDSEKSCVNGREFVIKNYVNRRQRVGE